MMMSPYDEDWDKPAYQELEDQELAEMVYETEEMMFFYQHEAADGRIEDDELVDETIDRLVTMRDGAIEQLMERNDLATRDEVETYLEQFDL
ncbi:MAG: hypothetical protein SVU32_03485 [Candidatus Nanohaloarchaea archaeon]|nr:hypothetical protein [Candidatus Nanohaloarchaea archaeon]